MFYGFDRSGNCLLVIQEKLVLVKILTVLSVSLRSPNGAVAISYFKIATSLTLLAMTAKMRTFLTFFTTPKFLTV